MKDPFLHPTSDDNDDPYNKRNKRKNKFDQGDHQAHNGSSMNHLDKHQANLRISQNHLMDHQDHLEENLDHLGENLDHIGENLDQLRNHWHSVASLIVSDPAFSSFVSQVALCTQNYFHLTFCLIWCQKRQPYMGDRIHTSDLFRDGKITNSLFSIIMFHLLRRFLAWEGEAQPTLQLQDQLFRPSQHLTSGASSKAKVRFWDFTAMNNMWSKAVHPDDQILRSLFVSYPGSGRSWLRSMFEVHQNIFPIC